jgi:uncharacterized protein YndB with AHSA1/START domain
MMDRSSQHHWAVSALRESVTVPLRQEDAFALFTAGLATGWPRAFSWSGEKLLLDIGIEAEPGGRLFEIGPHGLRWDWGRVLRWEPPLRLVFTWQIGPDRVPEPNPDRASEVEVMFTPLGTGTGTSIEVEHRSWERHGEAAARYREQFLQAWPHALHQLAECARKQ